MQKDGIVVSSLTVVTVKGKLKFKWRNITFDAISLSAFGITGEDMSVPILVFRRYKRNKPREWTMEHRYATCIGGHHSGPIQLLIDTSGEKEYLNFSASDFKAGALVMLVGCREVLTKQAVKDYSYKVM